MSQYQSITQEVDENQHHIEYPSNDLPQSLHESNALLNKAPLLSKDESKTIKNGIWSTSYVMLAVAFSGFSLGFSCGFFAAGKYWLPQVISSQKEAIVSESILDEGTTTELFNFKNEAVKRLENFFDYEGSNENEHEEFAFPAMQNAPRPLIYLNRIEAYELLLDSSMSSISSISQHSSDFFLLSSGLDVQMNQAYCGVATAVAVINSLRFLKGSSPGSGGVNIPVDPLYEPYAYATQVDVFDECTQKHVIAHTGGGPGVDDILTPPYGLSMDQISNLLRCHLNETTAYGSGWSIATNYVDQTHMTVGKMRFELKNALKDPNSRVLVNYLRSSIGQAGGGHWSPVGSYSEKQDAFLVLDVAKYKYPAVWVPTERLYDGMATFDDCGSWNFPSAQDDLSEEERMAQSKQVYASDLVKLDCKKKLRGFIIVTKL